MCQRLYKTIELKLLRLIIVDSQQRFDTEIGELCVLRRVGGNGWRICGGGGGVVDRRGSDFCGQLMSLILVPLALSVLPMTDQSAHLTEPFAARFTRERFVLHVHVSVENEENVRKNVSIKHKKKQFCNVMLG